jgi:hypothetical protein
MIAGAGFTADVIARFKYYKALGDKTFAQLSEEQIKWQPSPESNSITIIVQHMYGNMMSRFTNFLTEDGEKPWRKRDAEFEVMDISKQDLVDFWETGWSHVLNTINNLTDEQLNQPVTIRSEKLAAYDAILRQLAHYSYHIGQIVVIGKMIKDAGWQNLSVPKGGSHQFNQDMQQGGMAGGGGKM